MDQAVVERAMEEYLQRECGVAVQYDTAPVSLVTYRSCEDVPDHSIELQVSQSGKTRSILTRYVIGADGAQSWTRKQAGIDMVGARTCMYQQHAQAGSHRC